MKKIRRANAVIDTDGSIEQTHRQVDALLEAAVSGAPVRRRRPPQSPRLSDDALPERPPVPRRAVRTLTIETEEEAPRRHGRARSPFDGLPSPVRFLALALAVILLVTGAVSVTKTYLAKQEERRRLEARPPSARSIRSITAISSRCTPPSRASTRRSSLPSSSANRASIREPKAGWARAG